ncbi:MAG: sporulation initiation factor Spo0A C-terminal domain-containing protein [Oscillospiraceae bacterium]|jgi:two-component system response regulator (stage 0 sporulation protein A)|nr:sporulation initiation factor Spo0A C-terminal domain-containing protein [Oscillospiraceae bacterium]
MNNLSHVPATANDLFIAHEPQLRFVITGILHALGIPAHIVGYRYLREAVTLLIQRPQQFKRMTCALYPHLAEQFQTTPASVERAMRHAVRSAWKSEGAAMQRSVFQYFALSKQKRPTNGELISTLADGIQYYMLTVLQAEGEMKIYSENIHL